MNDPNSDPLETNKLFANLKDKIKKQLKEELLREIYQELKQEESEPSNVSRNLHISAKNEDISKLLSQPIVEKSIKSTGQEEIVISVKAILKIASHAIKYANKNLPRDKWVEVIGLLAGKLDKEILYIEDAFPMGHGNAVYAEVKDYKNYARAFMDIQDQKLFICGWYHSHPTYGLFLSEEDMGTQARYQRLWNKSVALVMDPYMIDGSSYGFDIFRSNYTQWYPCPYKVKGLLSPRELPDILEFINPIVNGKALYLEYDE